MSLLLYSVVYNVASVSPGTKCEVTRAQQIYSTLVNNRYITTLYILDPLQITAYLEKLNENIQVLGGSKLRSYTLHI